MRRVALLGATGSIGRQALEVIDAHPELELCAAASGSRTLDGLRALTQVGGDLTELLEEAQPDIVLNAVVGFAGLPATLWTLEHGIDLALANKESLVAAGDLAIAAWERGGGRINPVDSEHSAAQQCLEGRAPETIESLVLTASGGPFRGRDRLDLASVTPHEALAHPTWNMGPKISVDSATLMNKGLEVIEAHFLFGLEYERIEVVVHPTSVVHALVRFRDGASLAHVGYPDMRVPISYALTYPRPRRDRDPAARLLPGDDLGVRPARPRGVPLPRAGASGGRGGRNRAVRPERRERGGGRVLPGARASLPRDPRGGRAHALERLRQARDHARRARRGRRRGPPRRRRTHPGGRPLTYAVAIFGLVFLILIHEAGHFTVARLVRMRPRKFYIFFPPAIWKTTRGGIEYGIGAIPLGGYVKIPGMHRPAGQDLEAHLARAVEDDPSLKPSVAAAALALDGEITRRQRAVR